MLADKIKYPRVETLSEWTYSLVFQFSVHLLDRVGLIRLVVRHARQPAVQVVIIIMVIVVGSFSSLQTLCSGKQKHFKRSTVNPACVPSETVYNYEVFNY